MMRVIETAACEVSPAPASIPHNLPTIPRQSRGVWFLSGISTDTEFVFINATTFGKVVKTAAEGWTREDADTFHNNLQA